MKDFQKKRGGGFNTEGSGFQRDFNNQPIK